MTRHKQVFIKHGDKEADVDERIAPLILEIWKAGIYTSLSCQNNQNRIWIAFLTASDAEDFLNIVGSQYEEGIDSLYNRVAYRWMPGSQRARDRFWDYDAFVDDFSVTETFDRNGDVIDEFREGKPDFVFGLSVRFPKSDLPAVLERMRKHNEGAAPFPVD